MRPVRQNGTVWRLLSVVGTVSVRGGFVRFAGSSRNRFSRSVAVADAGDGGRGATPRPRPADRPGGVDAALRTACRTGGVAGRPGCPPPPCGGARPPPP